MNMKKTLVVLLGCVLCAFVGNSYLFNVPDRWPQPVYDFSKNPLSENKILLGRVLFYDPILSQDNQISCASCHSPFSAFTHIDHALSHGIHDSISTRNSPALMNLAWQSSFMWDGAINHLDMQPLAPISHPAEMGSSIAAVVGRLKASHIYPKLFFNAFGDSLITGEQTLKAISQFMLTIVSANAKYDRVMARQDTFTPQESSGYALFQKNCASCHHEPLFTNNDFANNGLPLDSILRDYGRMKVTGNSHDSLKFKVPTLRNIAYSYPYMHDGRFKRLSAVVSHYTDGIQMSATLDPHLRKPIVLTANQKVDVIAFLLTLSDKEFIFNKKYQYPKEIFERSE